MMRFSGAKLAAGFAALALLYSGARPQADPDEWVKKNFPLAFEEFFPIEHAQGDFLAVRAHRNATNDMPEFSIVLEDAQDAHALHATVREAQGSSIYQQLAALHAQRPSRSYGELKSAIKVQTWRLSAGDCPAVAAQLNKFQHMNFVRPRDDDDLAENPVLYQVHESIGGGDSEVLEFVESRAIPKWTNETRAALDSCIASATASGKKNP